MYELNYDLFVLIVLILEGDIERTRSELNKINDSMRTKMSVDINQPYIEVVKTIIDKYDKSVFESAFADWMYHAKKHNRTEIIELLLAKGIDSNVDQNSYYYNLEAMLKKQRDDTISETN